MSSHLQWFEPWVSSQGCGAGLPTLLSGVSGVALPHGGHHCQPAAKHRALIRTRGRSPCVHQTPRLLPGNSNLDVSRVRVKASSFAGSTVRIWPMLYDVSDWWSLYVSSWPSVFRGLMCTWSVPGIWSCCWQRRTRLGAQCTVSAWQRELSSWRPSLRQTSAGGSQLSSTSWCPVGGPGLTCTHICSPV